MCQMIFEVQGKTDNYIRLAKDGNGVEFLASRTLVEYEIQQEDLEISSKNNISRASLKFVFRRRMEYHVTNTFMQVTQNYLGNDYLKFKVNNMLL